jgi:DNA-binding transcriptional LysR family regulator
MKTLIGRSDQALVFAAVAEEGSFTRAAARLGCSKAHISTQLSALEAALGVQLLHRTTRRLSLTDAGRLYLGYAQQLRGMLDDAERAVSATRSEVAGRLRITGPTSFGEMVLPELILAFRRAWPAVEVDIDLSVQRRDLTADGFDVAFRSTRALEDHLVARPLGVLRELALGSPELLRGQAIESPADLARVPCIVNSHFGDDEHWLFVRDGESSTVSVRAALRVNAYAAVRRFALLGAGAVRLPRYLVEDDLATGRLLPLCPAWELPATPLYVLYPGHRHLPLRTRVFVDFVVGWFDDAARRECFH